MELYINIAWAVCLFGIFMGLPFLPLLYKRLDYCRSTKLAVAWFIFGTLILYYHTIVADLFVLEGIALPFAMAVLTITLMFFFAAAWQKRGRALMPQNSYSGKTTTFYDFTPRYALVKGLEIYFQNVLAATVIIALFLLTGSLWQTGAIFGVSFFVLHVSCFYFFGKEWAVFILGVSLIVAVVPTVLILLIPGGILYLFSFHTLMYLFFLSIMKYRALAKRSGQL